MADPAVALAGGGRRGRRCRRVAGACADARSARGRACAGRLDASSGAARASPSACGARLALGLVGQRERVDAVALPGVGGPIGEDMPQMAAAPGAQDLGARHAEAALLALEDGAGGAGPVEARPAGARTRTWRRCRRARRRSRRSGRRPRRRRAAGRPTRGARCRPGAGRRSGRPGAAAFHSSSVLVTSKAVSPPRCLAGEHDALSLQRECPVWSGAFLLPTAAVAPVLDNVRHNLKKIMTCSASCGHLEGGCTDVEVACVDTRKRLKLFGRGRGPRGEPVPHRWHRRGAGAQPAGATAPSCTVARRRRCATTRRCRLHVGGPVVTSPSPAARPDPG